MIKTPQCPSTIEKIEQLWEKEKMLADNIFFFSNNVFKKLFVRVVNTQDLLYEKVEELWEKDEMVASTIFF